MSFTRPRAPSITDVPSLNESAQEAGVLALGRNRSMAKDATRRAVCRQASREEVDRRSVTNGYGPVGKVLSDQVKSWSNRATASIGEPLKAWNRQIAMH